VLLAIEKLEVEHAYGDSIFRLIKRPVYLLSAALA